MKNASTQLADGFDFSNILGSITQGAGQVSNLINTVGTVVSGVEAGANQARQIQQTPQPIPTIQIPPPQSESVSDLEQYLTPNNLLIAASVGLGLILLFKHK